LRPRQGKRARSKKNFWLVSHFLHQNETTAGWQDPKIKFSLKINSPYYITNHDKKLQLKNVLYTIWESHTNKWWQKASSHRNNLMITHKPNMAKSLQPKLYSRQSEDHTQTKHGKKLQFKIVLYTIWGSHTNKSWQKASSHICTPHNLKITHKPKMVNSFKSQMYGILGDLWVSLVFSFLLLWGCDKNTPPWVCWRFSKGSLCKSTVYPSLRLVLSHL
jgi:hypothetical protein